VVKAQLVEVNRLLADTVRVRWFRSWPSVVVVTHVAAQVAMKCHLRSVSYDHKTIISTTERVAKEGADLALVS